MTTKTGVFLSPESGGVDGQCVKRAVIMLDISYGLGGQHGGPLAARQV